MALLLLCLASAANELTKAIDADNAPMIHIALKAGKRARLPPSLPRLSRACFRRSLARPRLIACSLAPIHRLLARLLDSLLRPSLPPSSSCPSSLLPST